MHKTVLPTSLRFTARKILLSWCLYCPLDKPSVVSACWQVRSQGNIVFGKKKQKKNTIVGIWDDKMVLWCCKSLTTCFAPGHVTVAHFPPAQTLSQAGRGFTPLLLPSHGHFMLLQHLKVGLETCWAELMCIVSIIRDQIIRKIKVKLSISSVFVKKTKTKKKAGRIFSGKAIRELDK